MSLVSTRGAKIYPFMGGRPPRTLLDVLKDLSWYGDDDWLGIILTPEYINYHIGLLFPRDDFLRMRTTRNFSRIGKRPAVSMELVVPINNRIFI